MRSITIRYWNNERQQPTPKPFPSPIWNIVCRRCLHFLPSSTPLLVISWFEYDKSVPFIDINIKSIIIWYMNVYIHMYSLKFDKYFVVFHRLRIRTVRKKEGNQWQSTVLPQCNSDMIIIHETPCYVVLRKYNSDIIIILETLCYVVL